MTTITPSQDDRVVCPVCWRPLTRERWDEVGCCLSPEERSEVR